MRACFALPQPLQHTILDVSVWVKIHNSRRCTWIHLSEIRPLATPATTACTQQPRCFIEDARWAVQDALSRIRNGLKPCLCFEMFQVCGGSESILQWAFGTHVVKDSFQSKGSFAQLELRQLRPNMGGFSLASWRLSGRRRGDQQSFRRFARTSV